MLFVAALICCLVLHWTRHPASTRRSISVDANPLLSLPAVRTITDLMDRYSFESDSFPEPAFTHGQLHVACSRFRSEVSLKIQDIDGLKRSKTDVGTITDDMDMTKCFFLKIHYSGPFLLIMKYTLHSIPARVAFLDYSWFIPYLSNLRISN